MKVFSLYFKILRRSLFSIIIYLAVFTFIFAMISAQTGGNESTEKLTFSEVSVAVFDHEQSPLTRNFTQHLLSQTLEVKLPEDEASIQEALYSNKVDYVLIIPEDFSENLAKDQDTLQLKTYSSGQTSSITFVDSLIESYFANWKIIEWSFGGQVAPEDMELALSRLDEVLQTKPTSSLISGKKTNDIVQLQYFFAVMNYVVIANLFIIVGDPVVAMEKKEIKERDIAAGYPEHKRTGQIFLAAYILSICLWLVLMLINLFLVKPNLQAEATGYLFLSSFVCLIANASWALFLVHLFNNANANAFLANVLSLLVAFSAGIFVPAEFLWPPFHKFAVIFPSYWDVQNQFDLPGILGSGQSLAPYYRNLAVMLAMAVLFFCLTLVRRRFNEKALAEI